MKDSGINLRKPGEVLRKQFINRDGIQEGRNILEYHEKVRRNADREREEWNLINIYFLSIASLTLIILISCFLSLAKDDDISPYYFILYLPSLHLSGNSSYLMTHLSQYVFFH